MQVKNPYSGRFTRLSLKFLLISVLFFVTLPKFADEDETLRIAVASNFITTARALVAEYQQEQQQEIILSPGSTGKLTTQIRFGAPYDVFLSADQAHPKKLITQGLGIAESLQAYAIGELVLISRVALTRPEALADKQQQLQIAIANPKIAPYGYAGKSWLDVSQVDLTRHRLVMGENINQTWHYFINGGADVALVAHSQIKKQANLGFQYWLLETPPEQLVQSAVILKASTQQAAAKDFLKFLSSARATEIIAASGYQIPVDFW